jgi:hypothetical protein
MTVYCDDVASVWRPHETSLVNLPRIEHRLNTDEESDQEIPIMQSLRPITRFLFVRASSFLFFRVSSVILPVIFFAWREDFMRRVEQVL